MKVDKKKRAAEFKQRENEIISRVEYALAAFENYKKEPNLNNYNYFKQQVHKFYNNQIESYTIKFDTYDQSINMLKSFKQLYPKQYNNIVKQLLKKGIDYTKLLEVKNAHLDKLISDQKQRRDVIKHLKTNFEENNRDYSPAVMKDAFYMISGHLDNLEKQEGAATNGKLIKVNYFQLFKQSFMQAEKNNQTKQVNLKNQSNQQDKFL